MPRVSTAAALPSATSTSGRPSAAAGAVAAMRRAWQRVARGALRKPRFDAGEDSERAVGGVSRQLRADRLLPYHWASLQVYGQPW